MASTSCQRRNHAKSYPVSLRHFQATKESLVFTSPPPLNLKSKLHLTSNLSNASENSLLSTRILADRTNLMHTQTKPKKRVKLNCVNPVAAQTIARRPLKSPKVYKLLQTSTADRLSTTVRPFPYQEVSTFKCEDLLTKIFRAPNNSKTGTAKKFSGRKSNENFGKSRNSLGNKGAMSTRITDITILGMSPGNKNNVLDFTGIGIASLDDLLVTDQSMVYHNTDKAEDLNRKLRSIFRGEKLDSSQNGEFEISVAEEKSDFKLKVFKTKPLIRQLKS